MAKNSYDINYEDKRFTQVKQEEKADLKESEKMYDGMINSSDSYYNKQIDAVENWGDKQAQLQQEQSDFTIEKIEQQKEQAHKDYLKEQSGAYVDWQKKSNQYGVNAEKQAENGLAFTGYSESSQVAMYNQYQNRVAMARESLNKAFLEYDNMMKDARLQNSAALAQIAIQTLQTTLELSLQGFQYKNQLILDKANAKANIKERSYNKYRDVLAQINTENALAEQVRQYNESLAEEKRQYNESLALSKAKASNSGYGNSNGSENQRLVDDSGSGNDNNGNNSSLKVDMNSVLDLGYGPISDAELDRLVRSGEVIEVEKNGVLTFKRATTASTRNKKQNMNETQDKNTPKNSTTSKWWE